MEVDRRHGRNTNHSSLQFPCRIQESNWICVGDGVDLDIHVIGKLVDATEIKKTLNQVFINTIEDDSGSSDHFRFGGGHKDQFSKREAQLNQRTSEETPRKIKSLITDLNECDYLERNDTLCYAVEEIQNKDVSHVKASRYPHRD